MTMRGSRGLVPFVELNGQEIVDSSLIIDRLSQVFHKEHIEQHLVDDPIAAATAHAVDRLVEGSFFWSVLYTLALHWKLNKQEMGSNSSRVTNLYRSSTLVAYFSCKVRCNFNVLCYSTGFFTGVYWCYSTGFFFVNVCVYFIIQIFRVMKRLMEGYVKFLLTDDRVLGKSLSAPLKFVSPLASWKMGSTVSVYFDC